MPLLPPGNQELPRLDHAGLRWRVLGYCPSRWAAAAGLWSPAMLLASAVAGWWGLEPCTPTFPLTYEMKGFAMPIVPFCAHQTLTFLHGALVPFVVLLLTWVALALRLRVRHTTLIASGEGVTVEISGRSTRHFRWSELRRVWLREGAIALRTTGEACVIPAPAVDPEVLQQVVDWLQATHERARREHAQPTCPPAGLLALMQQ